jgi:hypothetical protein
MYYESKKHGAHAPLKINTETGRSKSAAANRQ